VEEWLPVNKANKPLHVLNNVIQLSELRIKHQILSLLHRQQISFGHLMYFMMTA
jgi:hypothetical protein